MLVKFKVDIHEDEALRPNSDLPVLIIKAFNTIEYVMGNNTKN
jgi:hypothetical protein